MKYLRSNNILAWAETRSYTNYGQAVEYDCKNALAHATIDWLEDRMEKRELLQGLLSAETSTEALALVNGFRATSKLKLQEKPLSSRPNNRGTVEVATDPGRSVIERVTNAVDALFELEYHTHAGKPDCRTPSEDDSSLVRNRPPRALARQLKGKGNK